jgi:hypothetical protein
MRVLLALIVFLSFLVGACHSSKSGTESKEITPVSDTLADPSSQDTIRIENEELEYEIIILEVGFNQWLQTQRPMWYFTENVLENRNRYYVYEWNLRAMNPAVWDPNLYVQMIDYQSTIRYGLEVNYMLYMYFEFFQQKYKQRL